jgi:hypothetical protein
MLSQLFFGVSTIGFVLHAATLVKVDPFECPRWRKFPSDFIIANQSVSPASFFCWRWRKSHYNVFHLTLFRFFYFDEQYYGATLISERHTKYS